MATTSFSNWDFHNYHVQQDLSGGMFVSAETTLVGAGPPAMPKTFNPENDTTVVYPIGLLETMGLQQSRQLQRIFEIGSSRSYFIPGRVVGSITIGRTFYFGPSLLRVLYAYYKNDSNSINIGTEDFGKKLTLSTGGEIPDPEAPLLNVAQESELHDLKRNPGYGYFFMDLASDLFAQPTGLAVYFKDINFLSMGAFYLEQCYVQGHQMTISSGSVLIMEGASLQYDRLRPIKTAIKTTA